MGVPSSTSVLGSLTQSRLVELARGLGVSIPASGRKDVQIARLLDAARLPLPALLGHLYRDELADLVARGYLVTTGAGAGTRYRVVRDAVPLPAPTGPVARLDARLDDNGFITNTDYREAFGVDRQAATAGLAAWVSAGVVLREGEKRGARYTRGPAWPPHICTPSTRSWTGRRRGRT